MKPLIIGFDPGKQGGLAVIDGGANVLQTYAFESSGSELAISPIVDVINITLARASPEPKQVLAYIEKVGAMPEQGVVSMFNFGRSYGSLLGVCAALRIPVRLVIPQLWKSGVLAGTDKSKDAAVAFCRRRWPDLILPKVKASCEGVCDALCIALHGWRMEGGNHAPQA